MKRYIMNIALYGVWRDCLAVEDRTDRLSRNVSKQLPICAA